MATIFGKTLLRSGTILAGIVLTCVPNAFAQNGKTPALIVTNQPLPPALVSQVYTKPSQAPIIEPSMLMGSGYYDSTSTLVSRKLSELHHDLGDLQATTAKMSERLAGLEKTGQSQAAEYFASVGTINTQLQSGTTPGNPRLLQRLATAQSSLDKLGLNVAELNELAVEVAQSASVSSFLLEGTRAAYGLTGAVEEDHVQLAQLEDSINNTIILIDRLQNNLSDDITRTSAYLTTERSNLRTLSLAVTNGDLYGKSLATRPFTSQAKQTATVQEAVNSNPASPPSVSNPRPLVKIRFDRQDVDYEQPVYMALNEAMDRFPNARFEIVAVHPSAGNPAQISIESTKARRNAEKVLRTMTQMGLSMEKVDISYAPNADISANEVHIYVR